MRRAFSTWGGPISGRGNVDLLRRGMKAGDAAGLENKDIELVMQQASCTREQAIAALHKSDGDIVSAIMELTG